MAAVGDIMLGGTATPELRQLGYDYPFERTRDILKQAHVVFGNLEGPLTHGGSPILPKQYLFRSPPEQVAPALARAGFTVVSLANNHSLDYGSDGLEDTRSALSKAGIRSVGAGRNEAEARTAVFLPCQPSQDKDTTVVGTTLAILAYSLTFPEEFWSGPEKPGTAFGHEQHIRTDVAAARQKADIVVVSFHWGQEGKTDLRDYQMLLAHAAIESGAMAVIGHHPHILQGIERYRDGIILYSLGNFSFGSYSKDATRSAIALISFQNKLWHSLKLIPINVQNSEVVFQPRPLSGAEADEVVHQLQNLSQTLGTRLEAENGYAFLSNGPKN